MLKWIKLECEIEGDYNVPFFTGSLIRGVLGYALKRVVCVNPSYDCSDCMSASECSYYTFYEEKNCFHPYRLGLTLQPNSLNFSFYLFEEAVESMPYMLATIIKAFEEIGIGKDRAKMKVSSIKANNTLLYDGSSFIIKNANVEQFLELDGFKSECKMEFSMPLRMKKNNVLASNNVELHTLIVNIHNRYRQLKGLEPERLGYRVQGEIVDTRMKFVDTKRYSNRQKTTMNMGGLMGSLRIKGIDKQSYMYLKIGEVISVGKQSVFGLGSYTLKEQR